MTFESNASKSGAEPVYLVSIQAPQCINIYGSSPCAASVGVTGDQKCFNTRATCQDPANINVIQNSYYTFIEPVAEMPKIVNPVVAGFGSFPFGPFPFLAGPPSFSPSELDPSGGFGIRSSISFSLMDSAHHDIGIDLYVDERTYNPMDQGTFFGRFLARNPFYIGQRVIVSLCHIVNGEIDISESETLVYFIESVSGPNSQGRVSVKAKDALKLADNLRAQCPEPSPGTLLAGLGENDTSFLVAPLDVVEDYPSSGSVFKVRIGEEIVRCKREGDSFSVVNENGDVSIAGRAIDNTQISSHREDATVQVVKEFLPSTVPQILTELLTEFATIPTSFIDSSQWNDIQSQIGFLFSAQISEPEGVQDLCEQLLRAAGAFIYWDERSQLLKLGSIIPTPEIDTLPLLNDDSTFIEDSVSVRREDGKRLSQVWYYRGLIDSTEDLDDSVNYENRFIARDLEAETTNLYGQKKIERVYARWTPRINAAAAFAVAGRRLNRFRRTPRMVTFQADTKDSEIWQGDLVALSHRNLQDASGLSAPIPFQILRASYTGHSKLSYTALEYDVSPVGEFDGLDTIIIDQDTTGANLLNIYESTIGPASQAGEIITVLVLDGVNVRGVTGGGFPSSTIRFVNRGTVAGLAGAGGAGAASIAESEFQTAFNAGNGGDGGDAVTMNEDWEIINFGNIYGGAGGGGGGGSAVTNSTPFNAAGGGGGGGGRDAIVISGGGGGNAIALDVASSGTNGEVGDSSGAGLGASGGSVFGASGGNGGDGGDWASAGSNGSAGVGDGSSAGGAGGSAGRAIVQNGFALELTVTGNIIGDTVP